MFTPAKRVPLTLALVLAATLALQIGAPAFANPAHANVAEASVQPLAVVAKGSVKKGSVLKASASLHLRKKAAKSSKSIAVLAKGTKVTATGKKSGKWLQVKVGKKKGWASSKYLKLVPPTLQTQTAAAAEAPKRLLPAKPLPATYTALHAVRAEHKNGKLPAEALCAPAYAPAKQLLCGAPVAKWQKLNRAFKAKFGHDIPINVSYRKYKTQVQLKEELGKWAAEPGTSNHGWGLAIDLLDQRDAKGNKQYVYGAKKYEWLKKHGPKTGWVNPDWAQEDGSLPEPWHFEFVG